MEQQETVTETITIGLYGVVGAKERALAEIDNIKKIFDGFNAAAHARGKASPKIVLSAYLIPRWEESDGGFNDSNYASQRREFVEDLQHSLAGGKIDITVEDFYEATADWEKKYLEGLMSNGSNADMIKTHAIIRSKGSKHLQMDTNTQVIDYQALYDVTFGDACPALQTGVMLNASCYAAGYVAGMNKIVYTTSESAFIDSLTNSHLEYCKEQNRNYADQFPSSEGKQQWPTNLQYFRGLKEKQQDGDSKYSVLREKIEANSIYSKAFAGALAGQQLVTKASKGKHTVYLVDVTGLGKPEFNIIPLMVTETHQSWRRNLQDLEEASPRDPLVLLSGIGKRISVEVGSAICDFDGFQTLLQKYTDPLEVHKGEGDAVHKRLLSLSNTEVEHKLMQSFFCKLAQELQNDTSLSLTDQERTGVMKAVVKIIPDTPYGNELVNKLFNCNFEKLRENPFEIINSYNNQPSLVMPILQGHRAIPSWIISPEKKPFSHVAADNGTPSVKLPKLSGTTKQSTPTP